MKELKDIDYIDTYGKSEIICPYCEKEISDSWEYSTENDHTEEIECDCGKTFTMKVSVEVSYNSYAICGDDHPWKYFELNGKPYRECKACDAFESINETIGGE